MTHHTVDDFESNVCGIPCVVVVERYEVVKGSRSDNAVSDADYRGWQEIEFRIFDRRGHRAEWLERKAKEDDRIRIENEILSRIEK